MHIPRRQPTPPKQHIRRRPMKVIPRLLVLLQQLLRAVPRMHVARQLLVERPLLGQRADQPLPLIRAVQVVELVGGGPQVDVDAGQGFVDGDGRVVREGPVDARAVHGEEVVVVRGVVAGGRVVAEGEEVEVAALGLGFGGGGAAVDYVGGGDGEGDVVALREGEEGVEDECRAVWWFHFGWCVG